MFIKQKGNYKNGKKDGEWLEYYRLRSLKISGTYNSDKKTGIWVSPKEHGQVLERYDYDTGKKLQPIIRVNYLIRREDGVSGSVTVSYHVTKDCLLSDVRVMNGLNDDCDKIALEAIKGLGELLKKYGQYCEEREETQEVKFVMD